MPKPKKARTAGPKVVKGIKIPIDKSKPTPCYLEYRTQRPVAVSLKTLGVPGACPHRNKIVCYIHNTGTCHTTVCYPYSQVADPLTGVPRPINCPGCGQTVSPTYIKCIDCGMIW
jgi:hypothetical protein